MAEMPTSQDILAEIVVKSVFDELDDRSMFNGIDDDTIEDLKGVLIEKVRAIFDRASHYDDGEV